MWIFGYGSLIWRPSFDYLEARPARTLGWTRRFWQASPDHRGTPQRPGRVVTLVASNREYCDGVAFRIAPVDVPDILAALDIRESGGYVRHRLQVEFRDGSSDDALTYIAFPSNDNFLGAASEKIIAEQIAASVGASGTNTEYLLRLAEAFAANQIFDGAIESLAKSVRQIVTSTE